ncbi:putative low complexity [Cryptosporidium sp. chipmunk genotype I]|uniref:putative low complexity n=1 Tax=Cryptosporidium sp. chipmunk genotype I TaxID=1280935 RepID=UPI00351A0DF7|nr:putative low complexity [Cryptosporidium sp. chipmunk genotype I]
MSWWLEKLTKNFTTGLNSENSGNHSNNNTTSRSENEEEVLISDTSIFSQIYELNGCYKCTLRASGVGLGSYKCDVIFMEKQLLVLHLVSRCNLNISRILAPIAATAFATSFNGDNSKVSKGEWIVLPFDHITQAKLQNQGKEVCIVTKAGISYVLGDNEECISKVYRIYNERKETLSDLERAKNLANSKARSFTIHNTNTPVSSRKDIGEKSFSDVAPLANIFPGCIISITATELAEILTSDLFYGKYILDPKETFELEMGKWEGQKNNQSNGKSEFCLKQGASRDIQYRRKISTGVLDIWVSFTEKHQISFPTDYSFIHILISVKFTIFEKEIRIKILIRMVEIEENKTQFDLECELENTSSLPYLIRYQLESSTINNIKSTVENYIKGIKDHLSEISCSGSMDTIPEPCSSIKTCNLNYPEHRLNLFKQPTTNCDESTMCCFQPFNQVLKNLFQL